jgi:DNA primase
MSEIARRQRILENTSITEVVGEHLSLRGEGFRRQSLCPFHDDHLSTFSVDPVERIFTCSACGATGDVVDFVRMVETITDLEALDMLENRPKL